ncbi:hybrid sensor histidine kinase/response regulator [Pseudomonas alcaligenes]|uniref:Chemotaxis protein CheA n=2 Tax=Pseudomonadaceae TaxID=135621 RepID=A0A1V0M019_ECTOL|nr:response regulator [Pseudomonas alcaligenes]ARD68203.1 Chemotaxis protein cheA [Pseudomonas oleovorans]MBC9250495.1 hybrid sensor histidine kinase/response regulator [Pseudomonas alcaligenes]
MSFDKEALRQRLLASFRGEAEERLAVLADGLANWRESSATGESIESLFREVHSLKGASRAAGIAEIERVCHAWESLLGAVRRGLLALNPQLVELCRHALRMVQGLHGGQTVSGAEQSRLIESLEAAAQGEAFSLPEAPVSIAEAPQDPTTVRVSTERLDVLLFQSESLLQHKLEAQAHARSLQAHVAAFEPQRAKRLLSGGTLKQLRDNLDELPLAARDSLKGVLDYLDWSLAQLDRLHFSAARLEKSGQHLALGLAQLSETLFNELQAVLLLSGSSLMEGLPAMVQDIASQAGKRAELQIRGESLQVDKRILDELRTVLTHLLRNAIDHGLETPEQRSQLGKDAVGRLQIELIQESADRFELRVSDDGSGIDVARLKERAQASGLLSPSQAQGMTDSEALALIFASGLSTSAIITDLSGRGLGMAIVQEVVERLGGRIDLESQLGSGTCFHLHLPLSLSTFRAVIVRNAERVFAIPALAVERCLRVPLGAVKNLENRPTLSLGDAVLPVWTLAEVLGLAQLAGAAEDITLVVLKVRGERFALLVEELLGDQEIIVKGLGRQLLRVRNLLGATLLGDGQLVPILRPADLYRSALESTGSGLSRSAQGLAEKAQQRVLIAEDSFTSRGLLKAILEGAGYQVATANDGLEAWNALKQGQFDLLVSDVEMPRLDGFTLTSRIRADGELLSLPVVLVTALHSAEDRARGLEAGANAYLVKSGFEQDSLLDAIRRLI